MNIKSMIKNILFFPGDFYNFFIVRFKHVSMGKNMKIKGKLVIMGNGNISIGDNVVINSSVLANPVGGNMKTIFYVINKSNLSIGENSGISNVVISSSKGVTIGNNVKIGGGCGIYDTDFHSVDYIERRQCPDSNVKSAPIYIGNDVFIGANSLILKGVTIGDRSIIGAGSVITKSIPNDELWAGNPAKFVRKL